MRFKLDENMPEEIAVDLRMAGNDADTVADERLTGAPDPLVVAAARRERRILLTMDKGIANLIEYPATAHAGVVLFRPGVPGRGGVIRFIRSRRTEPLTRDLEDRITVVSAQRIRGH